MEVTRGVEAVAGSTRKQHTDHATDDDDHDHRQGNHDSDVAAAAEAPMTAMAAAMLRPRRIAPDMTRLGSKPNQGVEGP